MPRVLEDITVGASKSPAQTEGGYRWEDANRRVRNVLAGETVADSTHVKLLIEPGRLPVFYFPAQDVRQDLLEPSEHHTESSLKGTASYWHIRIGDRLAENAVWRYPTPPEGSPAVQNYYAFYWHKLDHWYEENDEVFAHARDPHKRIDVLRSSRHVQVILGGVEVANTRRPTLLLETGLVTRFYIPFEDIRKDLLLPTDTHSRCPYKGEASYWSVQIGDRVYKDILWSYPTTLPEAQRIAGLLSFYNERVDAIIVDDAEFPKPVNDFFRKPDEKGA
jgi:uncharacterized protein (DUF427 family)